MKPLAPAPVHYRLAPGGGLLLALAALLVALGAVLLAWLLALRQAQQTGALRWWVVMVAYGSACVWSWRTARALPSGWLVWNGKFWQLQMQSQAQAQRVGAGQAPAGLAGQAFSAHTLGAESSWAKAPGALGAQPVAPYAVCTLVLDMQRAVLLRLQEPLEPDRARGMGQGASRNRWMNGFSSVGAEGAAAPAVWVWASRASDPLHWHALRCALVGAQTHMPAPQAMRLPNRPANSLAASAAQTAEAAQASQAASANAVNAPNLAHAGSVEPTSAGAWGAEPSQHRGTP